MWHIIKTNKICFSYLVRFALPLFQYLSLRVNLNIFCAWMLQSMAIFQRNFIIYLAIYVRDANSTFPQCTQTNVRIWQFLLGRIIEHWTKVQASAKAAKRIERKQHARFAGFNSPARLRLRQTKPPAGPQARRRLKIQTEIGSVSSLWCFDAPAVLSTEYRSRIQTPKAEE